MRRSLISFGLAALFVLIWPATGLAATLVPLGTAGNYAVLGAATVTNTGPSWITGEVGLSPGTSVTGFPPGTSGHQDIANGASLQARIDLTNAYNNAAGQVPFTTLSGDLGGRILVAGTYRYSSTAGLTGTVTLDGGGITTGVWIFQIGSALTTASSSRVTLINGAQPCDVFWQVGSSATLGTSSAFVGNILANTSITMTTGATLNGRALAGAIAPSGAVTLDTNRIIQPSGCGYPVPAYVAPPAGNILPATLGVPWELRGSIPWLLVIGVGAGLGATAMGISSRRRRRRSA
ncbi:MAG TPA: ice-binding family protein [Candidatus Dormibacteraeota bacterium]